MALAMHHLRVVILLLLTALPAADSNTCGLRPLMSEYGSSRIIGGVDAQPGAWPWLVSIQVPSGKGHRHSCGGTLINEQWVLTAAHCFKTMKRLVAKWQIVLGGFQLSDLSASDVQIRSIDSYVQHENYNPRTERDDVALIRLNETVKYTDYVQPACLPDASADISALDPCYISGWGVTKEKTIQTADILQEAKVNQIPLQKCNSSDWYDGDVYDFNLCAGYEEGGIDSCQGDSGGPLMCMNPDSSTYYVIGVTSWGQGCGRSKSPGVYSNTQRFIGWIRNKIGTLTPEPTKAVTPSLSGVITSTPPPTGIQTEDVTSGIATGTTPLPTPTAIPSKDITSGIGITTPPPTVIPAEGITTPTPTRTTSPEPPLRHTGPQPELPTVKRLPAYEPKDGESKPKNVIDKLELLYMKMTLNLPTKALHKIFGKISRQMKN